MSQFRESGRSPFRPIRARRSSERVADAIRETIVGGSFGPGDLLPPERDLAERFQVTRNTVREALRQLEQMRLVHIRQGSGVRVQDYLATAGVELLAVLLRTAAASDHQLVADVLEARALLGAVIFDHAIDRIDADEVGPVVEAIGRFCEEATRAGADARSLQDLEVTIHARLIRGGGNRAFVLLYNSLRHVYARVADLFEGVMSEPEPLAEAYRRAGAALSGGDRDEARRCFQEAFLLGQRGLLRWPAGDGRRRGKA